MAAYKSQQDLIDYIAHLERRIDLLEKSAVRIDVINQTSGGAPAASPSAGRIVYWTPGSKLYGANGSTWSALW